MTETEPRIWVGCLACYNAGCLIGHWFDATEGEELTVAEVHAGHFTTPAEVNAARDQAHEEIWVMDHEGFDGVLTGETSPMHAAKVANALLALRDNDTVPYDALVAYASNQHLDLAQAEDWISEAEDKFQGGHDSWTDYVYQYVEDTGMLKEVPETIASYFDFDSFGRDLAMDYDVLSDGDTVWVFSS